MLIFKDNKDYSSLFLLNKSVLELTINDIYKSEEINETACVNLTNKFIYYYAAFIKAKLIKDYLNVPLDNVYHTPIYDSSDWKEKFNYHSFKSCLFCKNIDFDKILNQIEYDI